MKITFIHPYYHNIFESLGIGYIVSYLKKHYVGDLDINFFHGNFNSEEDILKGCKGSNVVALSATTTTFKSAYGLAKKIKELNKKVKIVFGGWHVSTAKTWIDNIIDHIVYGEGEVQFYKLIQSNRWKDKSILYNNKSQIEFSELPWPDREFIVQEKTLKLCEDICGERIISFQSRRGCPMSCKMCGEHNISGKGVRVRDTDDLLDEIKYTSKKYNATQIKFVDPTWCYPKKAAIDFCEKKISRGVGIKWEAMVHANFVDKELLKLMKQSNCKQINVGCESGSQKLLNDMNKGVTVEKIKKVFKWGHELDIEMRGYFLLGMPNETWETIEETKKLIREIKPDVVGFTILTPFPGSYFYKDEYKDLDWSGCSEYDNDFWHSNSLTNQQLKDIQKQLNIEFKDALVDHQKDKI